MLNPISLNILLRRADELNLIYFYRQQDYWFIGYQLAERKGLSKSNFSQHYVKEGLITSDCKFQALEGYELKLLKKGCERLGQQPPKAKKVFIANSSASYHYLIRGLNPSVNYRDYSLSTGIQNTYYYLLAGHRRAKEITLAKYKVYSSGFQKVIDNNLRTLLKAELVSREGRGCYVPIYDLETQRAVEDLLLARLGFGVTLYQELLYIAKSFYPLNSLKPLYHLFLLSWNGTMNSYSYDCLGKDKGVIERIYCQQAEPRSLEEMSTD